jgi:hypothetical protein
MRHRRVVRGVELIGLGVLGPLAPTYVVITHGDWGAPSERGWGKLLAIGVLGLIFAGVGALIDGVRCLRQAGVAARSGWYLDAQPFEGSRREWTGNLLFNRWGTLELCGVDLFRIADDDRVRPALSLEVDRAHMDRVANQVVALYGVIDGNGPHVIGAVSGVVWKTSALRPRSGRAN